MTTSTTTSAGEIDPVGADGATTEQLRTNLKGKESQLKALEQVSDIALYLFIVGVLSVVGLLLWGTTEIHNLQWQTAFSSIALSLIASLAYALFYSRVVERRRSTVDNVAREIESLRQQIFTHQLTATVSETVLGSGAAVAQQVNDRIHTLLNEESTRLVEQWPALLPANYFPASEKPDQRFHDELISAIRQSTRYTFRGSTGRYVVRTLIQANPKNTRCCVLIMDPTNDNTLRMYARSRLGANDGDAELQRHIRKLREEVYTTIVSLFDYGQTFNIAFRLTSDPLFYRSEVLDDCAFVSFFTRNERDINPETYRYNRSTGGRTYFVGFSRDAQQVWDAAKPGLDLSGGASVDQLEALLKSLKADEFGDIRTQIDSWREEGRKKYLKLDHDKSGED